IPLEQPVEIERLVRPMESPRSEMHGADVGLRAAITGSKQLPRSKIQCALAEAHGTWHAGAGPRRPVSTQTFIPVFQMASSRTQRVRMITARYDAGEPGKPTWWVRPLRVASLAPALYNPRSPRWSGSSAG